MDNAITLNAGDATLRIARRGAEPVSWNIGGRELLWSGGEAWQSSSPILFPIVGWARGGKIRVDGQEYPMGVHGFAASEDFAVAGHDAASATLTLADNATTLGQYPFPFLLEVQFTLDRRSVSVAFRVVNRGDQTMPFAIGLHPGFRWPFSGGDAEDYRISFSNVERAQVPVIDQSGLFSEGLRVVPLEGGRDLPLTHGLLAREALCFLHANSQGVRFEASTGEAIILETTQFPHYALWSRPPAPYLCIECWTGHGDPASFEGELADKPSMSLIAPGQSSSHSVVWRYQDSRDGGL